MISGDAYLWRRLAERIAPPSNPSAGTCVIFVGQELHIVALDAITSIEVGR